MLNRIIRNFTCFTAWVVAAIGCAVINVLIALSNYLGCKSSLELLNYERYPLGSDGVLEGFFQVFLSKATICNLFALSLNLSEIIGFFVLFHLAFRIYQLSYDRSTYLAGEDEENAKAALHLIIRDAVLLVVFTVPMVYAIRWDIWLFRFRSVAAALGIEDPEIAAGTIEAWEIQLRERGDLFALFMARIGGWGYVAVTAIACMGVGFSIVKAGECWAQLAIALGEYWRDMSGRRGGDLYGYDVDGQPVYDPDTPIAYDADGNPVRDHGEDAGGGATTLSAPESSESADEGGTDRGTSTHEPLFTEESETEERGHTYDEVSRDETDDEPQAVISDRKLKSVTLAYALSHPDRYWVDPETHEIWDAEYRRRLMGDAERRAA